MACPPGMRGCAATCGHRLFVDGYRQERQRAEIAGENASLGYAEELRDWIADNPMPTFKDWLIQSKQEKPAMEFAEVNGHYQEMPDGWNQRTDEHARTFVQFKTVAEADEASLLAIGMNTPAGIPALQALKTEEFANPFHRDVHRAILDLHADQQPHDAGSVTELLRGRQQLPTRFDPTTSLRTVDAARHGLAVWQTHALPADSAGYFASQVRSVYRQQHLEDIGTRAAELARGSLENTESFGPVVDLVSDARLSLAQELVNFPPELGYDAKPAVKATNTDAVDVWTPKAETPTPVRELHLPQRPTLSPVAQKALTLHGA